MEKVSLEMPTKVPGGFMIRKYPTEGMNLRVELERLLVEKGFVDHVVPLEEIHKHISAEDMDAATGLTNLTRSFYETDDKFRETYFNVLKYIHEEILQYDFVFQTTPTIRFHTPGRYHDVYRSKDDQYLGFHVDSFNGHPLEEINIWLPVTTCFGSNTLQMAPLETGIEALNRLLDDINYSADVYFKSGWDLNFMKTNADPSYRQLLEENSKPIITEFGELVFFDPRCMHSATDNLEESTRVSLDFRVISVVDYDAIAVHRQSQGNSSKKFTKGEIFFEKTISEI